MQLRSPGVLTWARWLWPAAALSLVGCPKQELAPLGPCTVSAVKEDVSQTGLSKVDLLFVIDNSNSMKEEQANLAQQLPRLVKILTLGDKFVDNEGARENPEDGKFQPVSSLRLAVITSELGGMTKLGKGEALLATCLDDEANDDGIFRVTTDDAKAANVMGCPNIAEFNYQVFEPGEGKAADQVAEEAEQVAGAFSCVAVVGTTGCAYEQQLEAMWKAIAPSTDTDFVSGVKTGHGSPMGRNRGFVREDAILAIIQVTDEEDCSVTAAGRKAMFEGEGEWAEVGQNIRCYEAEKQGRTDLIHAPSRYIAGLERLKIKNPDRLIFAGLVGIPEELEGKPFAEMLEHPKMQFKVDKTPQGDLPTSSCDVYRDPDALPEKAYPPRRFVQVAEGLGERAALFSICRKDYGPAVDAIVDRIAAKLSGNCLPRVLTPDSDGKVQCEVFELLDNNDGQCDPKKHEGKKEFRKVLGSDGKVVSRAACQMRQVAVRDGNVVSGTEGWFYDNFSAETLKECTLPGEQQRISFTQGGGLSPGSGATFECFQPVAAIGGDLAMGFEAVNTICDGNEGICGTKSTKDAPLACIAELKTCQITCKADPNCPAGWVCSKEGDVSFCQQPTCPAND